MQGAVDAAAKTAIAEVQDFHAVKS